MSSIWSTQNALKFRGPGTVFQSVAWCKTADMVGLCPGHPGPDAGPRGALAWPSTRSGGSNYGVLQFWGTRSIDRSIEYPNPICTPRMWSWVLDWSIDRSTDRVPHNCLPRVVFTKLIDRVPHNCLLRVVFTKKFNFFLHIKFLCNL